MRSSSGIQLTNSVLSRNCTVMRLITAGIDPNTSSTITVYIMQNTIARFGKMAPTSM